MTSLLARLPTRLLGLTVLPALFAIASLLLSLYWRCLHYFTLETFYLEIVTAVLLVSAAALALVNAQQTRRAGSASETIFFAAAAGVCLLSLTDFSRDKDRGLLILAALAFGVTAPLLTQEGRVPLPSLALLPGFLLGGLLLQNRQDPAVAKFGMVIVSAGLLLFLLMELQRRSAHIPVVRVRGLVVSITLGGLLVAGAVVGMGGACEAAWCHDAETYAPAVDYLRTTVKDGDAVLTILDPGTYDQIFQRCRLESPDVYRAFYPIADALQADALVNYLLTDYRRIYGVYVDADVAAYDPAGAVERRLRGEAYESQTAYFNLVRVVRYNTATPMQSHTSSAQFGDHLRLSAFAYDADAIQLGDAVHVELTWVADVPPDADYTVGVYLLDSAGALVAQHDAPPGIDALPTSQWTDGAVIDDRHGIALPDALTPGVYRLYVALYNAAGRLPVRVDGVEQDDLLYLGEVEVKS